MPEKISLKQEKCTRQLPGICHSHAWAWHSLGDDDEYKVPPSPLRHWRQLLQLWKFHSSLQSRSRMSVIVTFEVLSDHEFDWEWDWECQHSTVNFFTVTWDIHWSRSVRNYMSNMSLRILIRSALHAFGIACIISDYYHGQHKNTGMGLMPFFG